MNAECQRDGFFECTAAAHLHNTEQSEPDSASIQMNPPATSDEQEPAVPTAPPAVGNNSGGFSRDALGNLILKRGALESTSGSHSMQPVEQLMSKQYLCKTYVLPCLIQWWTSVD